MSEHTSENGLLNQIVPDDSHNSQIEMHGTNDEIKEIENEIQSQSMPLAPPPEYTENPVDVPIEMRNVKPPSYEEYEKEHENDDEFDTNLPEEYTLNDGSGTRSAAIVQGLDLALGDDFTFACTLCLSFFLNWIGFLLAYFFSRTIAGKCGATAGFGLGVIKFAFLIRPSSPSAEMGEGGMGGWIVWVMVLFGWFAFVRGTTLYVRYKREFAALQSELSAV